MLRLLLLACLASIALAGSAAAAPAQFVYDRELRIAVRETLWHALPEDVRIPRSRIERVYVRCYRDRQSFERAFERRYGVPARRVIAYYAGGGEIHLRGVTCANVRLFLSGRVTVFTAAAFAILLHESLHRQGLRDERITTCLANEAVRWGALWRGFTEEQALRAQNLAFTYTKLYAPPSYVMGKPTCRALARKKAWTAFASSG